MSSRVLALIAGAVAGGVLLAAQEGGRSMTQVRLMTLDPGHFHAALVQKEMYPGVAPRVDVFAPLGPDLVEHLNRIVAYNRRSDQPTTWDVEVHTSSDYFERMLREHPGNVVVFSGRNRVKIDRIAASVSAGLNVLGDKPWILKSEDLPKLEQTLAEADKRGVVAYDIMTERFEITSILQRAFVNDPATFGEMVPGTDADPGVYMESVHYLMKLVSGAPNIRPAWFFDTAEQGEGLNDIGTHLVDLVQWTLFPDTAIDYRKDVQVVGAQRWPTTISQQDFQRVTKEPRFPASLGPAVKGDTLEYLLQYPRCLHAARHSHEAERDLGLGASRRIRRYALRVLSRNSRARRNPARPGRSLPAGALRDSRRRRTRHRCSRPPRQRSRPCRIDIQASRSRIAAPRSTSRSRTHSGWATRHTSRR